MRFLSNPIVILFIVVVGIIVLRAAVRAWQLYRRRAYFADKVVVLTGASRGIGRELALALARRGARLVLAARNADQLAGVAQACREVNPGVDVLTVPTDVTDEAQLVRLVDTTLERFSQIDILISNAGIIQGGAIADVDFSSIRQQIEVNLMASIRLVQLALQPMLARKQGHIVLMASAGGRHSSPYLTAYCTSKHGLVGFGEGLRRELMGKGVRVLIVNPGYTATDMVDVAEPAYRKMGFRMVPPERVARLTLEGIMMGAQEITIGFMEMLAALGSVLNPTLSDLYWRLFMPEEFPELVSKQRTE